MLEEIVETIEETIKVGWQKKSALFVIKRVVNQPSTLERSARIWRISLKSGFLKSLISEQDNTLQNMKELIMRKMMI